DTNALHHSDSKPVKNEKANVESQTNLDKKNDDA
ncbi:cbb3-type cytochrome oxidase assembly protein CcoS, partial [Vibrio sp. 10N.222.48.A3]